MSLVVFSLGCHLLCQRCSVVGKPTWSLHVGLRCEDPSEASTLVHLHATWVHQEFPQMFVPHKHCQMLFVVVGRGNSLCLFFSCALYIFFGFWHFQIYFFTSLTDLTSECLNLGKVIFVLASLLHSRFMAISSVYLIFCFIAFHL